MGQPALCRRRRRSSPSLHSSTKGGQSGRRCARSAGSWLSAMLAAPVRSNDSMVLAGRRRRASCATFSATAAALWTAGSLGARASSSSSTSTSVSAWTSTTGPLSTSAQLPLAECNVSAELAEVVAYAELGDCPENLISGASCWPLCAAGYSRPSGAFPLLCEAGSLGAPGPVQPCGPSPCNITEEAPWDDDASQGDCPEELLSGDSCRPSCGASRWLASEVFCTLGVLTPALCELASSSTTGVSTEPSEEFLVEVCSDCGEGEACFVGAATADSDASSWSCHSCSPGFFKELPGYGNCSRCPPGTYAQLEGSTSCIDCPPGNVSGDWHASHCEPCEAGHFSEHPGGTECQPCPAGSFSTEPSTVLCTTCPEGTIDGVGATQCGSCADGWLPTEEQGPYGIVCRQPYDCNLTDWSASDIVGHGDNQLRLGTCPNLSGTLLHTQSCHLRCDHKKAAQVASNIFEAVTLQLTCHDGKFISGPDNDTLCTDEAWKLPPVILLGTVTLVTIVAAGFVERRQLMFESKCVSALATRVDPVALANMVPTTRQYPRSGSSTSRLSGSRVLGNSPSLRAINTVGARTSLPGLSEQSPESYCAVTPVRVGAAAAVSPVSPLRDAHGPEGGCIGRSPSDESSIHPAVSDQTAAAFPPSITGHNAKPIAPLGAPAPVLQEAEIEGSHFDAAGAGMEGSISSESSADEGFQDSVRCRWEVKL